MANKKLLILTIAGALLTSNCLVGMEERKCEWVTKENQRTGLLTITCPCLASKRLIPDECALNELNTKCELINTKISIVMTQINGIICKHTDKTEIPSKTQHIDSILKTLIHQIYYETEDIKANEKIMAIADKEKVTKEEKLIIKSLLKEIKSHRPNYYALFPSSTTPFHTTHCDEPSMKDSGALDIGALDIEKRK